MKLYAHQQKIIDDDPKRAGLWLGTGSGKTRTALMLGKGLILVVCPKTQKEDGNWEREWKILKRKDDATLTVVSKEEFRRDWKELPDCDTLIVDEAHTCLGVTPNIRWVKKEPVPKVSQLFAALDAYVKRHEPERIYLCTATIVRNPMTVWGAAQILMEKSFDWHKFRDTFYVRLPMPGREIYAPRSDTASKERLAKAVQKLGYCGQLSDYFDVPEQSYKTINIELSDVQKKRLKELPFQYPDPIVLLGKRHQVENGVLAGDEYSKPEFFKNDKIQKLLDLAMEFPRLVVFAKYRAQIENIATALGGQGYNVMVMTGDTKDRGKLIEKANKAKQCVFICQAQISAGWELPTFPVMVFASMSYSVVDRIQAEGRILRANALKKNLYIDLVVRGGIDEAVKRSIDNKKDFNEKIYLDL